MSGFNFSISKESSAVRNVRRQLTPWEIHDVKFTGVELREFEGKKDPSQKYKTFNINFENEDGYFSVTLFYPKDGDDVRREFDGSNGGKVVMPSNFEVLKAIIMQTIQVLNPTMWEKFVELSSKFRSADDMINTFAKIMEKVKGVETKIKLIGKNRDGKVVADIPRIVAINKSGESFISDNYVGNKLFFSDYEETQRTKFSNATPTPMASDPLNIVNEEKSDDSEFDLESLL